MKCAFTKTDQLDPRGRYVHKCQNCGREIGSKYEDPAMVNATCSADPQKPGLIQRAMNFARAATEHIRTGRKLVSDEERTLRLATCNACELFADGICSHPDCGCPMKAKRGFIDALGWASKKCPLGKWPG